jgi:hypothetical protein
MAPLFVIGERVDMIWRFARVLTAAPLLGAALLAFPSHPSAASPARRGRRPSPAITVTVCSGHPIVGHFIVGKNTYTYSVSQSLGPPQQPEPEPEVWPLTFLHGPSVDPSTSMTVTWPDLCQASISDDDGYFDDFTIWQHLLDPNGAEINPTPNPHWTSTKPSLSAGDNWNLEDPVEGNYTCKAEFWVYDYELDPPALDVKTLSYAIPTGETTTQNAWSGQPNEAKLYKWDATLSADTGVSFAGRVLTESDGGNAVDTCWFQGSAIYKADSLTGQFNTMGHTWTVATGNTYGDDFIGWLESAVTYYRGQGRAPCQFEFSQVMSINRPGSQDVNYKTNRIEAGFTLTSAWSERDGHSVSKNY